MAQSSGRGGGGLAEPRENLLLRHVSDEALGRLSPHLVSVALRAGERLAGDGRAAGDGHFYFVGRGIVSLLYTTVEGDSAEMAVIGREGGVGLGNVFAAHALPGERVVQVAGSGWCIDAGVLREEFIRGGSLQEAFLVFSQALTVQTAQTAVCNRHHTVEQQFIRWVLLCLDRLSGNDLAMTQEAIARMLGVRRAGVTEAAGRLSRDGVLELTRGRIRVIDRPALEARSCECYRVIRDEYAGSWPGLDAWRGCS